MKRFLLIALLACGLAYGQRKESGVYPGKGDLQLGAGIGINYSNISTGSAEDIESGSGLNVAVSGDYFFNDRWSVRVKLIYDQKGYNGDNYVSGSEQYVTDINLNYFTVPVMANWHFGKKRQWYLNFGPYAAFLLNAKETERGRDVKDGFNPTDFGLELGVGVKIPLTDDLKMFIEFEESGGFSDISKGDGTITNRRGQFNIGLNLMLN